METLYVPRLSATVIVRCVQCGDACEITERQHRRKLQEGRPHKCALCRAVKVKPPTESDYNYWLKRYTIGEIREMAQAIWG